MDNGGAPGFDREERERARERNEQKQKIKQTSKQSSKQISKQLSGRERQESLDMESVSPELWC